ncbi:MAG: esterase [Actinobacteria bacterium]|nr:esterase [Actinomycetota bacterium]
MTNAMLSQLSGIDTFTAKFVAGAWLLAAITIALAVRGVRRTWLDTAGMAGSAARRRTVRTVDTAAWSLLTILSLVVASAVSLNAYFAYLPTVGDAVDAANGDRQWINANELSALPAATSAAARQHGLVTRLNLAPDRADGFGSTVNVVYLPPQYFTDPSERFPVLYLFHGSPGRAQDWFHAGQAQRTALSVSRAGRPVIVVAAQMSRSWTDDPECVDGINERVETHFVDDVLPNVDGRFRTDRNREGRIFAGMSAGGYCALNLGLRHRDLTATIIDMSGDTRPTHTGGAPTLFGSGVASASEVAANDPSRYAPSLTADPATRIWLDSGSADHDIIRQMTAIDHTLVQRGIEVQWRVRPGGHTYWVWTSALTEALPWALGAQGSLTRSGSHAGPTTTADRH